MMGSMIKADGMGNRSRNFSTMQPFLVIAVVTGLVARLSVAMLGINYDMNSWFTVAEIERHGGCIYAETDRYNYGPVWFLIIHLLDVLAAHRNEVLRYLIAVFLSLVDLGIFFILLRRAGKLVAVLFFLNPISILVTGFHGQFDNLAILLGLLSLQWIGENFQDPVDLKKFCGLLLLGLSLMTKHLFFAFPLWLAIKQKGLSQKAVVLIVPLAFFLLGFAPYWTQSGDQIRAHVFQYGASCTGYFYKFFVPQCVQYWFDAESVWYILLVLFAFICRSRTAFESLLIYTGVLVAFSPATSNQYLVIPVALAAYYCSPLFIIYTIAATFQICVDSKNGLHLFPFAAGRYDNIAIYVLCFAVAYLLWKEKFNGFTQAFKREVGLQFGRGK